MSKNLDCRIVQDLLPSYVDGLTCDYTKQEIEAHIKTCEKCSYILQGMRQPEKREEVKKEVDYMKKVKKHMSRLAVISISSIAVLIIGICVTVMVYNRIVPKEYEEIFKRAEPDFFVIEHPRSNSEMTLVNDEIDNDAEMLFELLENGDYYYEGNQGSSLDGDLYYVKAYAESGAFLYECIISDENIVYYNNKVYNFENNQEIVEFLDEWITHEPEWIVWEKNAWSFIHGVFELQGDDMIGMYGNIQFDFGTREFLLSYDPLSSQIYSGEIIFEDDDTLRLVGHSERIELILEKVDDKTLRFVQSGSDEITALDGKKYIEDGVIFKKVE